MTHLFEFDFTANHGLRLELYDQDEDDAVPFDDHVDFWPRGVGHVTKHLNGVGRGPVVAAWNGLFFGYSSAGGKHHNIARHVAPVVLAGKPRYFVGNHRWTFGVQYRDGRPQFTTLHLPDRKALADNFTYAAAGAQCLVREAKPLKVQPFPQPGEPPLPQPVPSTPADAGHVPGVDHMRTSRTSMGWSRDSQHFYLLIVKEPDSEGASSIALRHRIPLHGGWMVADLQCFWLAKGVWGAVNIDGGEVTQLAYRLPDGRYGMVPPRYDSHAQYLTFTSDFPRAPAGGTLMYFYVRDITSKAPGHPSVRVH
ncbi:MAG: hypothetical protein ACYDCO_25310 [Armatimonadota bacterium]